MPNVLNYSCYNEGGKIMKKIILSVIVISLMLSACGKGPNEDTSSAESVTDSHYGSYPQSAETFYSEDVSEIPISEESEESFLQSDDSSEEETSMTTQEICKNIAAINAAGFETNITNNLAAAEISALEAYLQGTGYGVFYCDLEFNGYIASGCDVKFKTASTSKLPYIKYLATLIDSGDADPTEMLLYSADLYDSGSGILKSYASGGYYSVATLMDYVLRYSDNIAYKMLFGRFGLGKFSESLSELGVEFETYNGYGNCTAAEMGAMLYDVALYDGKTTEAMKDAGCNASYNRQIGAELTEYPVLQKYGAIKPGNVAYHDIAIVYAPHPYILVIYTTIDYESANKDAPFRTIARMVDNINSALYD